MSSFNPYGKLDEIERVRFEARQINRKRIAFITLSSILLVVIVVAAVVGTRASNGNSKNEVDKSRSSSIQAVCDVTLHKDACYNSLAPAANPNQLQPEQLFKLSIQVAMNELSKASQYLSNNGEELFGANNMTILALQNCQDLLSLAMDHLNNSLASSDDGANVVNFADDLRSWLSSAGTSYQTCIDGVLEANPNATSVEGHLKNSADLTSNCLAIITWISKVANSVKLRRLMSYDDHHDVPKWLHSKDRKLLESSDLKTKADVIVAQDGTGKYKKISDALKRVPDKRKKRYVIYVKKGTYLENVRVENNKWNVMIIGDGMNATIVSGSLNFMDGTPTFSTATFAVFGKGFIAQDMGFNNTAGPRKHQAVAVMSSADMSVFYRCSIDSFQDSLYTHSNRQFYRECYIYGTVDFIFGNSAVVFQNCNILPRTPMKGQQNTITAQGKIDPNQNTGISIQNCTILPYGDLTYVQTFLGRPWKNYSTTVFMHSMMGSLIDPSGWLPWTGNTAPPTIFYAEFENSGPGSSTKYRVKWVGLKNITNKQASEFTVKKLIKGEQWLTGTSIDYKPGL